MIAVVISPSNSVNLVRSLVIVRTRSLADHVPPVGTSIPQLGEVCKTSIVAWSDQQRKSPWSH